MPLNAVILALAAAVLHAFWNLIVKQAHQKQIFTWLAVLVGATLYLPLLFRQWPIPQDIWPFAITSALAEAGYFMALVYGYNASDFSLVYPLGRGAGPAFLAICAVIFLGEQLHTEGIVGIGILVSGLVIVGSGEYWSRRFMTSLSRKGIIAAVWIALCLAIYSTVDGAAVRLMEPTAYTVLVLGLTGLFLTPVVLVRFGRRLVYNEWKEQWRRIVVVGLLMIFTYILVLHAFTMARVSYVGALREFSVVLAALAGWRWLGEQFGVMRTIGAILIFCGMIMIATAG